MTANNTLETSFLYDEKKVVQKLKRYLPTQQALKDFVHHNTLHAFQNENFFDAVQMASESFGAKSLLSIEEYQKRYKEDKISDNAIHTVLKEHREKKITKEKMLASPSSNQNDSSKVGQLRMVWKDKLHLDVETIVNHTLFKIIGSYLDQGISDQRYRAGNIGLLETVRKIESNSLLHFFHSPRARKLLFDNNVNITDLLELIVGDKKYFEQYLFDQQFSHPGWSGFVATTESNPSMLFDPRPILLTDFIILELLLELDTLDCKKKNWKPISALTNSPPIECISTPMYDERWAIRRYWQEALELSYHDQVIKGLISNIDAPKDIERKKFQSFFCIDDREESLRRMIELVEPKGETFGSPAHYSLAIKYRPKGGKFNAHVCPGSAKPEHIIVDDEASSTVGKDIHFNNQVHNLIGGWLLSQTLGFWSAIKLFINIFKPSMSPGHSSAFEHMSHKAEPQYEHLDNKYVDGLQVGFTKDEMVEIVFSELSRTGLTHHFAPLVYFFGHGGSSTNNPYYAGYNCGACSGKPSSLNARVFSKMANRQDVREELKLKGIDIPNDTIFIGGLHDTTRDELVYYLDATLPPNLEKLHLQLKESFDKALSLNAKERSRQFMSINSKRPSKRVHQDVKLRSLSLFEPRPELNHSNNCLCIVGKRALTKSLFLDQRAFLSSYDYSTDNGQYLTEILGAATPVCGGINLEYFFSKVDNELFGSGSKLPHNVVGLFGVANGIEGDLRTGLPSQMIDVHEPLRLMMIVEQEPEVVKKVLQLNPNTKAWYDKGWLLLTVISPSQKKAYKYMNGTFHYYEPFTSDLESISHQEDIAEQYTSNTPVLKIN